MYDEQSKSIYEDNKVYEVTVMDLLTPEVTVFVCGLNGVVREYPTKKPIQLTGAQIKMLMSCSIPEEQTETVEGLRTIVGHTEYPRFSITLRKFGVYPTEKATILGQGISIPKQDTVKRAELIVPSTAISEEKKAVTADEVEDLAEPEPQQDETDYEDRKNTLEAGTRKELEAYAETIGLKTPQNMSKATIIKEIIKREDLIRKGQQ